MTDAELIKRINKLNKRKLDSVFIVVAFIIIVIIAFIGISNKNNLTDSREYKLGKIEAQTVAYNFIKSHDNIMAEEYYDYLQKAKKNNITSK